MDKSKLALEVEQSLIDDLTSRVNSLYDYVDNVLPDCIAKKFTLEDLSSVLSYFECYLKPCK